MKNKADSFHPGDFLEISVKGEAEIDDFLDSETNRRIAVFIYYRNSYAVVKWLIHPYWAGTITTYDSWVFKKI